MGNLWSYDWPGNVRELVSVVERLFIMCEDSVIDTPLLRANLISGSRLAETRIPTTIGANGINLNSLVRELEGRMINEALKQTSGNKQAAAKLLGLKRTTFAAKLRRCGVIAPAGLNDRDEGSL